MHSTTVLPVLMAALVGLVSAQSTDIPVTGILGNATVVENNPPRVIYTATLPTTEFNNPQDPRGNIKGSVSAVANSNGIGVAFSVDFSNFPTSGGPFLYHIHAFPVTADGNCTNTLGHLDPFERGETPGCDSQLPQTCQVGDLSGKHGSINTTQVGDRYVANYVDDYPSTLPGIGAFFGNRSITVHFANKTRITCANFELAGTSVGGTANATASSTSSTPAQFTGDGTRNAVSMLTLMTITGLIFFL
ncbi:Superoxide dismutase, copper/zinc binding domain containing protein [Hyaloscypha variabilis]